MNIVLDFKQLIRQYIAPHRRKPKRIAWLCALVNLQEVYNNFSQWRDNYRLKIHVTSQHKALQEYLNLIFSTNGNIIIKSYTDQFLHIGLDETEKTHWVTFDELRGSQRIPIQEIPLEGEGNKSFNDVDFIVYANQKNINVNLLNAEIEKYKLADKAFKIITGS